MADVLPCLAKLSRTMQKSNLDFSILQPVIDSCIMSIEEQQDTPGRFFSEIDCLTTQLCEANHPILVTEYERVPLIVMSENHTFVATRSRPRTLVG